MPQNLLILAANPFDTEKLRWEGEIKAVRDALRRSEFQVFDIPQADISGLHAAFHDHVPRIAHFIGHGEDGGLLFNDAEGYAHPVRPDALADLFRLFRHSVHCVVLNVCWSQAQAAAIHAHIPVVIGMSGAVRDLAALDFASGFYGALGEGKSYREAFEFGCNAMQLHGGEEHPEEHLKPLLLCRDDSLTPRVFSNPYKGLLTFRQADKDLFCGRERETTALLEWLDDRDNTASSGVIPQSHFLPWSASAWSCRHQSDGRHEHRADDSETLDKGHGRLETRRCRVVSDIARLEGRELWAGLKSVVEVRSTTEHLSAGRTGIEERRKKGQPQGKTQSRGLGQRLYAVPLVPVRRGVA